MSQISYEAGSAPFSGTTRPSISDIAALTKRSAVTRWSPPPVMNGETAKKMSAFGLILALILTFVVAGGGAFMGWQGSRDHLLAINPPAKSMYVAAHELSRNFIAYLGKEQAEGINILVVSDRKLELPDGITFRQVPAAEIHGEGILVDQTRWYSLR